MVLGNGTFSLVWLYTAVFGAGFADLLAAGLEGAFSLPAGSLNQGTAPQRNLRSLKVKSVRLLMYC